MNKKLATKPNILLETSIFGFYYDTAFCNAEKMEATKLLLQKLNKKCYDGCISDYIYGELMEYKNKELFERLLKLYPIKILDTQKYSKKIDKLAKEFLKEKIIPKTKPDDALHLASGIIIPVIDILVSFNYKHIINLQVIEQAKIIAQKFGYKFHLNIYSPFSL